MATRISAVLFDMDGVLFDSEPLHMLAWQQVLAAFGVVATDEEMAAWIGYHDIEFATECERQGIGAMAAPDLIRLKRDRYYRLAAEQLQPFPGLPATIDRLSAAGILLAVITSSSREELERTLGAMAISTAFSVAVTADDTANRKPHPDPFLSAATQLGADPCACVVIEDSPAGIAAGVAAGCTVLAVTTSYSPDELRSAHHVFSSTVDALGWILGTSR